MRHERFLHILRFLNFSKSDDALNNNGPNYDRLVKLRHILDLLNDAHSKYYTPSENLTVDMVIIVFHCGEIVRQYIPMKPKCLGIKIHKLYDMSGYTYDMDICLKPWGGAPGAQWIGGWVASEPVWPMWRRYRVMLVY
jgi:hypothetical protein